MPKVFLAVTIGEAGGLEVQWRKIMFPGFAGRGSAAWLHCGGVDMGHFAVIPSVISAALAILCQGLNCVLHSG
ncbi:uncharacterized protein CC84DRAFT_655429 [Paraphaeosphaeria sporulosa]|uniref:Uncharacterized protein n=1 Tax=Paraphaeosphaeria sporulosa TaxID=1460663 RepID=A0A177CJ52_9PLEO|nr:uncharacterized protein CC84DRAFT_655429 [Paraphaeosphaeria sporulosa]OAG07346.1 hypothetical protein CC84DRAFT_655429 [Paraphaeosphaeria sporulosa]